MSKKTKISDMRCPGCGGKKFEYVENPVAVFNPITRAGRVRFEIRLIEDAGGTDEQYVRCTECAERFENVEIDEYDILWVIEEGEEQC